MRFWTYLSSAVIALRNGGPIYRDVFRPAAVEIGRALGTVARIVNVLLMPPALLADYVERIVKKFRRFLKKPIPHYFVAGRGRETQFPRPLIFEMGHF